MRRSLDLGLNSLNWVYAAGYRLRGDRRAVTALEYAIIAGCMVAVIIGTMGTSGLHLAPTFNLVASEL